MSTKDNSDDTSLYFTDGFVLSKKRVLIAAKLNAHSEDDFSRVLYAFDGDWYADDIEDTVHSVTYLRDEHRCVWLGQHGLVVLVKDGASVEERIADAPKYGNLNRVRVISGQLYVCGYGGQVYQRSGGQWHHMDQGLLVKRPTAASVDVQDIDGFSPNDLYAVGTGGTIAHFNGKKWRRLDSPTNAHLLRIKCLPNGESLISGANGTFLRGGLTGWQDLSDPKNTGDFWGLEFFKGEVYLAHALGIVRWSNSDYADEVLAKDRVITCHRLHAHDGVLWSFGLDDLFTYNGRVWSEVICPENEP